MAALPGEDGRLPWACPYNSDDWNYEARALSVCFVNLALFKDKYLKERSYFKLM